MKHKFYDAVIHPDFSFHSPDIAVGGVAREIPEITVSTIGQDHMRAGESKVSGRGLEARPPWLS
jgi:hypothetical protein